MSEAEDPKTTGPTQAELEFVEDFAIAMERMGLVRMTGRTIAWLMICDPPQQTFNQIAEVLQASKGSISTSLRFLTTAKWVTKTSRPGDRKDYYQVRPGGMTDLVRMQTAQYGGFVDTLERGMELLGNMPEERGRHVRELHDFFEYIGREFPAMLDRWDEMRREG